MREKDDQGTEYEDWIYGEPPKDVDFVRIVGDEVVRVETMKVDGQKIVKTEKEIDLNGEVRPPRVGGWTSLCQSRRAHRHPCE